MAEFRRKLYRRGSSFETTIPMPLLFALDLAKKHQVIFRYDPKAQLWTIAFAPIEHPVPGARPARGGAGGRRGAA